MAQLDIAEKRLPQDGRITLRIGGRPVDVRVSTLPTEEAPRASVGKPRLQRYYEETIRARLGGRLDALVNNAGISPKGQGGALLSSIDTDLRDWGKVFHVNFFAPIVLARGLRRELSAARGAVVNVTSIAGSSVTPSVRAAAAARGTPAKVS